MKENLSRSQPEPEPQQVFSPQVETVAKKVPTKGERVREIFEIIAELPHSHNQTEAYKTLENIFEQVEEKYYPEFVSKFQESGVSNDIFKMRVNGIDRHIKHNGVRIGVIKSEKNYTFLGANGAIEVQAKEGNTALDANPGNKVLFEKRGANGKGVWE